MILKYHISISENIQGMLMVNNGIIIHTKHSIIAKFLKNKLLEFHIIIWLAFLNKYILGLETYVNFKMDAKRGFHLELLNMSSCWHHSSHNGAQQYFICGFQLFNPYAFKKLKWLMQITLHMLPLEYKPIEVAIAGQIELVLYFDESNKIKKTPNSTL